MQTSVHPFNRFQMKPYKSGRYVIFADRGRLRDHTGESIFQKELLLIIKVPPYLNLDGMREQNDLDLRFSKLAPCSPY